MNNADVAINLELMKACRFYHVFDPNTKKIFGQNVYRLVVIASAVFIFFMLFCGALSFYLIPDDMIKGSDALMLFMIYMYMSQIICQNCILVYYADVVWQIFEVARLDFLKSERCRMNMSKLRDKGARCIRITNWYSIGLFIMMIQWIIFPLATNWFMPPGLNQRADNIFNIRYPVYAETYNNYYYVFFAIEVFMILYTMLSLNMFDVFTISICKIITYQCSIISRAFRSFGGHGDIIQDNCNEEYENFKYVLSDQIRLHLMSTSYYSVMKFIVLLRVAIESAGIIIFTYSFIVISFSGESTSIMSKIKLLYTIIHVTFQLFIYCYLYSNINIAQASITFAIYSCNWTMMDLKFKKLVLLAMQMNDASQYVLRASPKKIIDLQLVANVLNTSYNVVSVMVKSTQKNNI